MKRKLLIFLAFFLPFLVLAENKPLRIFIRAGEKTHGPGQHDHPKFLADWKTLLNERGATTDGGMNFPSAAQLQNCDVLVMYAADGGNIFPEEKARLETFLKRGGGMVVIHDAVCGNNANWFKTIVGGAWEHGKSKFFEGNIAFYFLDREHPITRGVSNFEFDDEMYYDLHLQPEARVLAATYKPDERNNKSGKLFPSVYDIVPQMWTYENTISGGEPYRAFVSIPGHNSKTFDLPHVRALLLRGIAWAGKRDVNSLCSKEELASLRYPEGGPTAPEKAAQKMVVHPDFNLNLVASEPLIEKPISLDWDQKGRLWIAETPEYPAGRHNSNGEIENRPAHDRISILEDYNGDGVMDKKSVFFDGLELVTSFVFFRDGVIVSQAPEILFLRDTNGDGKADKKELLYTGFGTLDTHAVVSNLRWGMDGWIYATLGYSGGHVKSGDGKKDFGKLTSGVIRFRPDGSEMEQVSSKNGNTWGLDIAWDGEIFFSQANGDHANHVVLPESVLAHGRVGSATSYKNLEDHKKTFPVRGYDKQAYVQIDHVGGFTAASGATIYNGGAWPAKWNYNYFVSEPTVNLVHRDLLKPTGASFTATKDREAEFLASSDLWFRPVHARVGPDGALYILDFYNQAVVHNDTRGPKHGPNNAAVRPDRDHYFGRIWRVQHKLAPQKIYMPDFTKTEELVKALEHPNGWVRMTANRLLVENPKAEIAAPLGELAIWKNPTSARVQALWILAQMNKADSETIASALRDEEPAMRKNAARIAAESGNRELIPSLLALMKDPDVRTRLAALSALQSFPVEKQTAQALAENFSALDDAWLQSAAVGIAAKSPALVLETALAAKNPAGLESLVSFSARSLAQAKNTDSILRTLDFIADAPQSADVLKKIALEEFAKELKPDFVPEWSPTLEKSLHKLLTSSSDNVRSAAFPLVARWDKNNALAADFQAIAAQSKQAAANPNAGDEQRFSAVKNLLSLRGTDPKILPSVVKLLNASASANLQKQIINALGEIPESGAELIQIYPNLASDSKEAALNQLLKRPEWTQSLLQAISDRKIDLATLGPVAVNRLLTHSDKEISKRASAVIEQIRGPQTKEKDAIIAKLSPVVDQPGDIEKGKQLFTQNCAICHRYNGEGKSIAPDLTGMGAHGPRELLVHVVDPNRVVEPNFSTISVDTKDGESYDGIIGRENSASILLRTAAGDIEISKKNIAHQKATGRSLMPEGFEALGGEALRDILAYLCASDSIYQLLDLKPAFTANSLRGIYANEDSADETLKFKKFGVTKVGEIPFEIANPLTTASGKNLIVLKGGHGFSENFPQKVEIPNLSLKTHTLHFLGGVAGWGFPCCGDQKNENLPAAKITVAYHNGQKDEFILKNGVEIADYNGHTEVPGSKEAIGLVERGQVRWFSRPVKEFFTITNITLESFGNAVAPTFVAITAETAPRQRIVNTIEDLAAFFPKSFGPIRVSMLGGGSSHDFDRWFNVSDSVTLSYASDSPINYTTNLNYFLEGITNHDVLYLCSNQPMTNAAVKSAIFDFAEKGGGLLLVHPAIWYNWQDWPEYNRLLVGGGARGHDKYGEIEVTIDDRKHPIMTNIPRSFKVSDELYHFAPDPNGTPIEVLATGKNPATGATFPVVWIVKHPKTRIVCITLGHDRSAHENIAYRVMLQNAMAWVAGKK